MWRRRTRRALLLLLLALWLLLRDTRSLLDGARCARSLSGGRSRGRLLTSALGPATFPATTLPAAIGMVSAARTISVSVFISALRESRRCWKCQDADHQRHHELRGCDSHDLCLFRK